MKREMYSNIIGKMVWNNCQNCKIWISDYSARIEADDNSLYDRIDIEYDKYLGAGEIKGVWVVWYNIIGEENCNLSALPLEEQKAIFEHFEKELHKV